MPRRKSWEDAIVRASSGWAQHLRHYLAFAVRAALASDGAWRIPIPSFQAHLCHEPPPDRRAEVAGLQSPPERTRSLSMRADFSAP